MVIMLRRKMFRDIRKNISQFITIFLMVMIGIMVYSGIKAYMGGMQETADKFYSENNLYDLSVMGYLNHDDLKTIKGLDNVNLTIPNGIYGLLGENGAGKSTLMNVLTTLLTPTRGTVIVNSVNVIPQNYTKVKKMIGYLPQELGMYPNLTVRETLEYVAALSGVDPIKKKKKIEYLLERTSLKEHEKKKNKQLSGGMKRRVGLAQALITDPQFLIVDEPTTGLDPEERIRIRNLLVDFGRDRSVLFSSHVVEDLASTCNDLCILKKGKKIYDGTIQHLICEADNHVFSCMLSSEEEFLKVQEKYKITGKNYSNEGIDIRLVSKSVPDVTGIEFQYVKPTLEDAYIYKSSSEKFEEI